VKANKKEFKEYKESEEYKERSEEKITPRRKGKVRSKT
jgi:hypothetical protein